MRFCAICGCEITKKSVGRPSKTCDDPACKEAYRLKAIKINNKQKKERYHAMKNVHKVDGSLAEIERKANEQGLTYGQYVQMIEGGTHDQRRKKKPVGTNISRSQGQRGRVRKKSGSRIRELLRQDGSIWKSDRPS